MEYQRGATKSALQCFIDLEKGRHETCAFKTLSVKHLSYMLEKKCLILIIVG